MGLRLFKVKREGLPDKSLWAPTEEAAQRKLETMDVSGYTLIPGKWAHDIRLSGMALQLFYRQMSTMVNSGMAIDKALQMAAQSSPTDSKLVFERLTTQVKSGHRLSRAMNEFPKVFTPEQLGVIKLSEQMGALHHSLRGLADLLEQRVGLRSKILSSLTYPACLGVGIFAFGLFFIGFILPKDRDLLGQFGADLPWISKAVMAVGDHWLAVLFATVLVIVGVTDTLINRPKLRSRLLHRFPTIGQLILLLRTSLQLRVLGLVVDRGGTIPQALDLMKETSANVDVRLQLDAVKEDLVQGRSLSQALETHQLFTPVSRSLVAVGYESGKLETMAFRCAEMCEFDVETSLATLISLIEPLMLAVAGLGAAVVILAGALPLLSIVSSL